MRQGVGVVKSADRSPTPSAALLLGF